MYKKRLITNYLMSLFEHFPVVAILGARQVGKSTLIENLTIDGLKTYVFDPILDQYGEKKDPEFFLQQQSFPLFLDEFQYAPGLSGVIKRFVDKEKKNGLILLSGSHQFSVIKNLSDSMAGRVAIVNLWPMSVKEITGKNSNFLEELFSPWFNIIAVKTCAPGGDRGIPFLINNGLSSAFGYLFLGRENWIKLKERLGFGKSLVLIATRNEKK